MDTLKTATPQLKKTTAQPAARRDGNCLREPYDGYKKENMYINPPKESKNRPGSLYYGEPMYKYDEVKDGQLTGRVVAARLKIDLPRSIGNEVICKSGLKNKLDYPKEERDKKAKDPKYEMKGGVPTTDYRGLCELLPTNPVHIKLRDILVDFYRITLEWMRFWGKLKGQKGMLPGEFGLVGEGKNPDDWKTFFFDHLRCPVWFKEIDGEEIIDGRVTPVKTKDFDNIPHVITLVVSDENGMKPSKLYEVVETTEKREQPDGSFKDVPVIDDVERTASYFVGTGFRAVPIISPLVTVCPMSLIRLSVESMIVPELVPLDAMEQLSTMNDMKMARAANREGVEIRSSLADVLRAADNKLKTAPPPQARKPGNKLDAASDDEDLPPQAQ